MSLHDLIAALTGAVTEAQDAILKHQLDIIGRYFDAEGRPVSFQLMLPKTARDAETHESRQVVVPLLSIVEPSILRIADFSVEFDIELGSLADPPPKAAAPGAEPEARPVRHGAPVDVPEIVRPGAPAPAAAPLGAAPAAAPIAPAAAALLRDPKPTPMQVGLASRNPSEGPLARLSIRVEGRPASEGLVRLIDALNKTI